MVAEIKLVVSDFDKVVTTLVRQLDPNERYKSIEKFQLEANDLLTKMIEGKRLAGGQGMGDDNDDEDEYVDDSEEDIFN